MAAMSVACQCGHVLTVASQHTGWREICPGCGEPIEIPGTPSRAPSDRPTLAETMNARPAPDLGMGPARKPRASEGVRIDVSNSPENKQTLGIVSMVVSAIAMGIAIAAAGSRSEIKIDVADLRYRLSGVEQTQSLQANQTEAMLDPASKAYMRVDAKVGFFLISCQNVQPYLDGQKVTLQVGNPQSVGYSGFRLKVRSGPKFNGSWNDQAVVEDWSRSLKPQDFRFTCVLVPGRWNEVEIVLSETSPERIGLLMVSIDVDIVSMGAPLRTASH
jgi:hypothetical protein